MNSRLAQGRSKIESLLAAGFLPGRACSRAFFELIRPLVAAGVLVEERSGSGRRMVVKDAPRLRAFLEQRFPERPATPVAAGRVAALSEFRDSKAKPGATPEMVLLRVWSMDLFLSRSDGAQFVEWTRRRRVASMVLEEAGEAGLGGVLAVVENPAVFLAADVLGESIIADGALYAGGKLSRRVLGWLRGQTHPRFSVLHLPDYDPAGLTEHLRLKKALGERARLWTPANFEALFERFGNRRLLMKRGQQSMLAELRKSQDTGVRKVVSLMDQFNAGLEQEALLLSWV